MKEKLLNNLLLKVASLILAFIVWMAVVNISNPIISGKQTVPVDILNEEVLTNNNLTYSLGKSTVTVFYEVRTRDSSLIRASDFRAYVDLKDYNVTGAVPVYVVISKEKESLIKDDILTTDPMVIMVVTEELQRKTFDLSLETTGTPEEGYVLGLITLNPDTVTVEGPRSQIGKIHHMGVVIDVDGANGDLSDNTKPVFYDANSNVLDLKDKVTVNREEIGYNVSILKAKDLTLDFEIKGTVASGYRFTGVQCDVKTIPVAGTKSVLASINTLSIADDKLNIEGATADKVVHLDLNNYLPPNTSIAGEVSTEVTVTLKIEPLTNKVFSMNIKDLAKQGAAADYQYTFSKDTMNVTVRGLKEDLDNLTVKDLNAALNVTGLEPGIYTAQVVFEVSEGFEIVNYTDFDITVYSEDDEEEPTRASTESPDSEDESEAAEAVNKEAASKEKESAAKDTDAKETTAKEKETAGKDSAAKETTAKETTVSQE